MKKYLYIFLVAILMASVTIAAGGNAIRLKGTIEAIDADAMTVTVNSVVVQVTGNTYIAEYTETGCVEIDFDDLVIGDRVNITGQLIDGVFVAKKIVVH